MLKEFQIWEYFLVCCIWVRDAQSSIFKVSTVSIQTLGTQPTQRPDNIILPKVPFKRNPLSPSPPPHRSWRSWRCVCTCVLSLLFLSLPLSSQEVALHLLSPSSLPLLLLSSTPWVSAAACIVPPCVFPCDSTHRDHHRHRHVCMACLSHPRWSPSAPTHQALSPAVLQNPLLGLRCSFNTWQILACIILRSVCLWWSTT